LRWFSAGLPRALVEASEGEVYLGETGGYAKADRRRTLRDFCSAWPGQPTQESKKIA
jgi:hypothetical protein